MILVLGCFKMNLLDETKLPVVNTVFRNLASVLPNISFKKLVNCAVLLKST